MRAVLASSRRPGCGQSRLLSTHGSVAAVRRSKITPPRRRLTLCDAFLVLLAPVLTAAFVADITKKDKKRQLWDQRIAQVHHETEAIRAKGLQAWNRLQQRSIYVGVTCQRRSYTTTTASSIVAPVVAAHTEELKADQQNGTAHTADDIRHFECLLARKVGLQLLIFLGTGQDPSGKFVVEDVLGGTVKLDSVDSLLAHLGKVHKELNRLQEELSGCAVDPSLDDSGREQLDTQISELTWKCRTGQISATELVYAYTKTIMKSATGPSLSAYQNLVETFSTLDIEALTFIAMYPYLKTKQVLSDKVVGNMIRQYGQLKDSNRLESFLRRLSDPEKSFRTETMWVTVTVNGVRVSVPSNHSQSLLDILIRVALQGDQPHKARAWATVLVQQHVAMHHMAGLFNNFLTYCGQQSDWIYGRLWLERAIVWAAVFADKSPWMLQRIIFRVLDLCLSCGQKKQYENIMNAVVFSGLDVPKLDDSRPDAFSDQARRIRDDWAFRTKKEQINSHEKDHLIQAAIKFQAEMAKINSTIENFVGITDIPSLRTLMAKEEGWIITDDNRRQLAGPVALKHLAVWNRTDIPHSPGHGLTKVVGGDENDAQRIESTKRLAALQSAYTELQEHYQKQCDINTELQRSSIAATQSKRADLLESDKKYLEQKLHTVAQQAKRYEDGNIQLQRESRTLQTQNAELSIQLETSQEMQVKLNKIIEELKLRLRPSLEAVFIEKENYNLRTEMKALSARYLAVMNEKEAVQNELTALQARRDKLEEKRAADLHLLRQDNENLKLQIHAANIRHQKLLQDSQMREGELSKMLGELKEASKSKSSEAREFSGNRQDIPRVSKSKSSFTLRSSQTSRSKAATQSSDDDSFSFSSS